jgi:hypothetical protein
VAEEAGSMRKLAIIGLQVLVLITALFVRATPSAAVEPFRQLATVQVGGYQCLVNSGDAAIGADGIVRGFIGEDWSGGVAIPPCAFVGISFYRVYPSGQIVTVHSPYPGRVLRAAWDGLNSTYLLFVNNSRLYVGKYVDGFAFAPATYLTSNKGFRSTYSAALTASNGKWWAVWGEDTISSAFGYPRNELFQAHTLLGTQPRTQITNRPANYADDSPGLAYANGRVTLVWTRYTHFSTTPRLNTRASVVNIATSTGGAWSARRLTAGGFHNGTPAVAMYGRATYIAWTRDDHLIMFASNEPGGTTYRGTALPTVSDELDLGETVAVSGSRVFIAWTAQVGTAAVAERLNGVWTQTTPVGGQTTSTRIVAQGLKARLLYSASDLVTQT